MKVISNLVVVAFLTVNLTSCGGGGGSSTPPSGPANYQTPVAVDQLVYLEGTNTDDIGPVFDIFAKDLNSDGVDEVIVAGRKSASPTNPQSFAVQIYGWNTGSFSNETSNWFSGSDNIIIGTEPAVNFGDFDNDNNIDIVMSGSTDTSVIFANTVVYFNNGDNTLTRNVIPNGSDVWSHDMVVYDFNGDNFDDFMVLDYGNEVSMSLSDGAGRTFTTHMAAGTYAGSGISVGDYIPGGNVEIVITDNGSSAIDDTRMFSWSTVGGVLTLTDLGTLAPSRYSQAESDSSIYTAHGIRNIAMDFDTDGDVDVIVFERLTSVSSVQFLKNDGAGSFTDVTDTVLVNYKTSNGGVNYQPIVADFNGDGLEDIFLSGVDYSPPFENTQVLLQSSDDKFVSSFTDVFDQFSDSIRNATTGNLPDGSMPHQIVKGPSDEYYIVSAVMVWITGFGGDQQSKLYISKLGSKPAISPMTAAELMNSDWTYLQ